MKKIFLILFVLPCILFGQEQSPCYSVNDYNISILEQNPPLTIDLNEGWNMIGYPCMEPMQVEDAMLPLVNEISLLKDNNGDVYWPEYGFNGIGSLTQLNGYQINLHESVESFSFCNSFEIVERFGCTDCEAFNFDIWATSNDGTCIDVLEGCTDVLYVEYNSEANTDDGSCAILIVDGCTDSLYIEYTALANTDDGSCATLIVEGCTNPLAFNFNADANTFLPGSCIEALVGCLNSEAFNYDSNANTEGDCIPVVYGCTDTSAFNYNAAANTDDSSCEAVALGCTDANYFEYNVLASQDDGSCQTLKIYGCIYPLAINFNENANTEDGSCVFYETPTGETNGGECDLPIPFQGNRGSNMTVMLTSTFITSLNATDENAYIVALTEAGLVVGSTAVYGVGQTSLAVWGYGNGLNLNNETISFQLVNGTYLYDLVMPSAVTYQSNGLSVQNAAAQLIDVCSACPYDVFLEYMPNANNYDVEYCVNLIEEGCTGEMYFEFNPDANVEDGSCLTLIVEGCTDINYAEYSAEANLDDGSCLTLAISGCTNPDANNYNSYANLDDNSCEFIYGCIDQTADNYNAEATADDSSCIYYGCMDPTAGNYYEIANSDDGSCLIGGCMNYTADNYNPFAGVDDGSCIIYGCSLSIFPNYNSQVTIDDGSCDMSSTDVFGCTDSEAINYDELTTLDNGSCDY